ncbi:hypothetical protein [Streptomyces sp. SID13726]|uniref:hypothetical protein n=1 Tax=Streptomyces sp. SID13726 TaxID=2706058 RepID=UPI0013B75251|nr:hypothetical protein [Streptomyces sp. SID13726]NEA98694.1 hypothetical protein [Streptomyces sp. SID13726]
MIQIHSAARLLGMLLAPVLIGGLVLIGTVDHVSATTVRAPASEWRQVYGDEVEVRSTVVPTSSRCGPGSPVSRPVRVPSPTPLPPPVPRD